MRGRLACCLACAALALACEGSLAPPVVPSGPPQWIAVDVELPVWELGRWVVTEFSDTLGEELAKYNIRMVDPAMRDPRANLLVLVDLGQYNYWRAIDVALARDHGSQHLGRVLLPDRTMPALDVAAELVASIIARAIATPAQGAAP